MLAKVNLKTKSFLNKSLYMSLTWIKNISVENCEFVLRAISLKGRMFANGTGDQGSIPGQVIPKTQKLLLDASLLNTQHYKVRIEDKVEQSREWSSALPFPPVL